MNKLEIVIDGNRFSDLESFYDEADRLLTKDLDWKTGHNLDAFNDLLRGGFGVHEYYQPIRIIWINSSKSRRDLGYEATIRHLRNKLKYCHPDNISFVQKELDKAMTYSGPTVFEILVEIICAHEHIELTFIEVAGAA